MDHPKPPAQKLRIFKFPATASQPPAAAPAPPQKSEAEKALDRRAGVTDLLREWRSRLDLTLQDTATRCGVTCDTYTDWEVSGNVPHGGVQAIVDSMAPSRQAAQDFIVKCINVHENEPAALRALDKVMENLAAAPNKQVAKPQATPKRRPRSAVTVATPMTVSVPLPVDILAAALPAEKEKPSWTKSNERQKPSSRTPDSMGLQAAQARLGTIMCQLVRSDYQHLTLEKIAEACGVTQRRRDTVLRWKKGDVRREEQGGIIRGFALSGEALTEFQAACAKVDARRALMKADSVAQGAEHVTGSRHSNRTVGDLLSPAGPEKA